MIGFLKCRDLEIQMLRTRHTLFGVFMALTYTGYGVLILKAVDGMVGIKHWEVFKGLCMNIAMILILWMAFVLAVVGKRIRSSFV